MATDVIMPQMGESIAEGTITKWLKKVGETVKRDEPIFEISTDKVDAEIPSPVAGTLLEIKVPEGQTVAINTVVASIGEAAEQPAASASAKATADMPPVQAAPPPKPAAPAPPPPPPVKAPEEAAENRRRSPRPPLPPRSRRLPAAAPQRVPSEASAKEGDASSPSRSGSAGAPPRWCGRSRPSTLWTSRSSKERGSTAASRRTTSSRTSRTARSRPRPPPGGRGRGAGRRTAERSRTGSRRRPLVRRSSSPAATKSCR